MGHRFMHPPSIPFRINISASNSYPWVFNISHFLYLFYIQGNPLRTYLIRLPYIPEVASPPMTVCLLYGLTRLRRSVILSLQVNKVACLSFMDADRKYETTGSDKKTLLQHRHKCNGYIRFFWPSSHMGMTHGSLGGCCAHSRVLLRNSKLKKPQSFPIGCKQTYLTFALMEYIIFIILERKQERHSLPRQFTIQTSLKRLSRTKASQYL